MGAQATETINDFARLETVAGFQPFRCGGKAKRPCYSNGKGTQMLIGSKVFASCDSHDIEGVIVAGFGCDADRITATGEEISLDAEVWIEAEDDGKTYRLNGWLWSFEAAA